MTTAQAGAAVQIPRTLTVRELGDLLGQTPVTIIKVLMTNGVMADVSKTLDFDTAAVVAVDLGFEPEEGPAPTADAPALAPLTAVDLAGAGEAEEEDSAQLAPRPPVVAVLGHVDHGKTSLLDRIRSANVADGEAGGITQRVGAYQASLETSEGARLLTFIDTPGHEAFTEMRARGANATDIAVLVVAANDGVMPQTREAIDHIHASGAKMVVALNKIDLENTDTARVKTALAEHGVQVEEYGGSVPLREVSATEGTGIGELLETIVLVADLENFQANPEGAARGVVLEAELDRRQGPRTTLLVQRGTLRQGDSLLVGQTWGRVKAMASFSGERLSEAGPSTPVVVLGLQDVAEAGDRFATAKSDREARRIHERAKREREAREAQLRRGAGLDALFDEISRGETTSLNLIVKTDAVGSVEALRESLERLSNPEVRVKVIHASAGAVSNADVSLAAASKGIVIAFNTGVEPAAEKLAEGEGIEIRSYEIIYEAIEQVEAAISGMLKPIEAEIEEARAEVLQVFPIRGLGNIAGCRSLEGAVRRGARARVLRGGEEIADGAISSLRRFQDDVQQVEAGQEFGVALERFDGFEPGDAIEFYRVEVQSRVISGGEIRPAPDAARN